MSPSPASPLSLGTLNPVPIIEKGHILLPAASTIRADRRIVDLLGMIPRSYLPVTSTRRRTSIPGRFRLKPDKSMAFTIFHGVKTSFRRYDRTLLIMHRCASPSRKSFSHIPSTRIAALCLLRRQPLMFNSADNCDKQLASLFFNDDDSFATSACIHSNDKILSVTIFASRVLGNLRLSEKCRLARKSDIRLDR